MPKVMAKTLFAYIFYDFASICDILYRKIRSVFIIADGLHKMLWNKRYKWPRDAKKIIFYSLWGSRS